MWVCERESEVAYVYLKEKEREWCSGNLCKREIVIYCVCVCECERESEQVCVCLSVWFFDVWLAELNHQLLWLLHCFLKRGNLQQREIICVLMCVYAKEREKKIIIDSLTFLSFSFFLFMKTSIHLILTNSIF